MTINAEHAIFASDVRSSVMDGSLASAANILTSPVHTYHPITAFKQGWLLDPSTDLSLRSHPSISERGILHACKARNQPPARSNKSTQTATRVSKIAPIGQGLPRNLFKRHDECDRSMRASNYIHTLALPDKSIATSYLEAYFEHGNATCRFLPRDQTFELLDGLYENSESLSRDDESSAIILLVIGTGCVWTASWRNEPVAPWRAKALPFLRAAESRLERVQHVYPPTIALLQAQVLKCQCELVLGRFNSAWMSLGWAVRLGQMIDIQKEHHTETIGPLQLYYRRRLFWAMFMIDRYLAVILGRPMAIHEGDITVVLSPEIDDSISSQVDAREKKLLMGTTLHYSLVRIIGRAASQLYPASDRPQSSVDRVVSDLEEELQQWLQNAPRFFHPDRPSHDEEGYYDVPWILKRQKRTVQSAYFFANMLIYRGYLLQEFRRQEPNESPVEPPSDRARRCADNALAMIKLAADFGVAESRYNGTFWITSHFLFCAISILIVYMTICQDQQQLYIAEKAVEDAMEFHRRLESSSNISAQKLLDESRRRTQIAQSIKTPNSSVVGSASFASSEQHLSPQMMLVPSVTEGQATENTVQWEALGATEANIDLMQFAQGQNNIRGDGPFGLGQDFNTIMDIVFDDTWNPDLQWG
ncbi:hypothetical protein AU210_014390 [Fusarium oxysporum f. sp. radicis-cucumerinum]|uniref:Xylanolytic transcriptional activator regulatory domain-containing protein n=1 Tax=Fusarium oxysporum f. sp. radicis-cucumerinum TaxID=327505 RepID=A0A2H3GI71_FUSOX|nr:hypothetical protein AU210_014390 [Fusarium oxysporum f. sp. radicis-cucumerinum]